jgi:hypothetical protein
MIPRPRSLSDLLTSIRAAIDEAESLSDSDPIVSRQRTRTLALLWAAHDELEPYSSRSATMALRIESE